jgi:hypothetical protein
MYEMQFSHDEHNHGTAAMSGNHSSAAHDHFDSQANQSQMGGTHGQQSNGMNNPGD